MVIADNIHPWGDESIEHFVQIFHKQHLVCVARLRTPNPPCFLGLYARAHVVCGGFLALMSAPLHK
jgi:hypothetical protein